jgi:hypothetical protein
MALNLDKVRQRLGSLSNTKSKTALIWKPNPGKQVIRIVPYKFNTENPFIELKFHYGLNGKTYLSPDSFNRPDPIVEFSNKLKKSGSKDEWNYGRKIEPKMRTFAPVIVRGEESTGVRFWGFGKSVYQEILSIIADPDYGDITDLTNGRDVVVEFKTAEDCGKQYPETSIRVKPNSSPAVDPKNADLIAKISNQTDILELFPELSYDELRGVMEAWLSAEAGEETTAVSGTTVDTETAVSAPVAHNVADNIPTTPAVKSSPPKSPSAAASKSNTDDVSKAFDNLFNS